ncbi:MULTISPECIES: hypothetical protein [Cupriavidus]
MRRWRRQWPIDVSLSAHRWQGAERYLDALAAYDAQDAFPWQTS